MSEAETWVLTERLQDLSEAIDRLNKKAKKLGGGLSLEVLGEKTEKLGKRVVAWSNVRLVGSVPVVSGWRFLARVEHHDTGNILSCVPGFDHGGTLATYRNKEAVCEHCGSARRRKDTFILQREGDGPTKQVGRSCLKDFLRLDDIEKALKLWSYIYAARSVIADVSGPADEEYKFRVSGIDTLSYLSAVCSAIRHNGWMSRGKYADLCDEGGRPNRPTCEVADWLCTQQRERDNDWELMQPTADDISGANDVLVWARSLVADADSEYMNNVSAVCKLPYLQWKHFGLAASAVIAYRREKGLDQRFGHEKPKAVAEVADVGDVGDVGERIEFDLVVDYVSSFEGSFGTTTLLVMSDGQGRKYKWFASGDRDVAVGAKIRLKATIKIREEYRGVRTTVLTRGKLLSA